MMSSKVLICVWFLAMMAMANYGESIGVNWGTQAAQSLNPASVAQLLKDNKISKIKLFDSDPWTVKFFAGTGIEVMLGIPNDQLQSLNDYDNAQDYVKNNVSIHLRNGGVNIKYIAVANEPFLKSYNGSNLKTTFPALKNIQKALDEAGLGDKIKATIPQNADIYDVGTDSRPSAGNFRSDIRGLMTDIVRFLQDNDAPFLVNIYPFLSLYENPNFPVDFAFFDGKAKPVQDGNLQYTNMFDANLDSLVSSLNKAGAAKVKVVVGEIGWPTDANINANNSMAQRFYNGLFKKLATKKGTPMHPDEIEVYLFSLTDENMKSVAPGFFERHWGIFQYDGKPKFPMDFSGQGKLKMPVAAKNVEYLPKKWCILASEASNYVSSVNYACSSADCTTLGYGGSCNKLRSPGDNASYAFNMYFQMNDQDVRACDFKGLGQIIKEDPSEPGCPFPVGLDTGGVPVIRSSGLLLAIVYIATLFLL